MRPGGALIFLVNSALLTLCVPEEDDLAASDRLLRRSGCIVSSGQAIRVSSSTCPTVTGSDCCGAAGSRLRTSSKSRHRKRERRAIRTLSAVGAPVAVGGDLEGLAPG